MLFKRSAGFCTDGGCHDGIAHSGPAAFFGESESRVGLSGVTTPREMKNDGGLEGEDGVGCSTGTETFGGAAGGLGVKDSFSGRLDPVSSSRECERMRVRAKDEPVNANGSAI